MRHLFKIVLLFMVAVLTTGGTRGTTVVTATLSPDLPSGQPVGTTVRWSVTSGAAAPRFRLSVGRLGEPLRVMYDYSDRSTFDWTPIEQGLYLVRATVRDENGALTSASALYSITSRVTSSPVVTPTANPLVALYSAPSCAAGQTMRLYYLPIGEQGLSSTPSKSCSPPRSMNFLVAGMRANTLYAIIHEIRDGAGALVGYGPVRGFLSGAAPAGIPPQTVVVPASPQSSPLEKSLLFSRIFGGIRFPYATDLSGRVTWADTGNQADFPWLLRPTTNGQYVLTLAKDGVHEQILQERDVAGHVLRETTTERITEQLEAMGYSDPFTSFHHEARRLPDGRLAVLGTTERLVLDQQGPGWVDVIGDYVVVLDANWQVVWAWSAYDHLDLSRAAVLGEQCEVDTEAGCPPLFLAQTANDWTHTNTISRTPADGDLILSMRHQDWVIKIDYADGAGSGAVEWRFGPEGDFTFQGTTPDPWPTHPHDPNFTSSNRFVIYDNGNSRCEGAPPPCNSRGQLFQINETALTASLLVNIDLGVYSPSVGSAQPLLNGNLHFMSGQSGNFPYYSLSDERLPTGSSEFMLESALPTYRSFRQPSIYGLPAAAGTAEVRALLGAIDGSISRPIPSGVSHD